MRAKKTRRISRRGEEKPPLCDIALWIKILNPQFSQDYQFHPFSDFSDYGLRVMFVALDYKRRSRIQVINGCLCPCLV